MMYKSPIEIISGGLHVDIDGEIIKAVHKYDIAVDKDELIRALRYDREQYEKGFRDGAASVQWWIPVTERLPEDGVRVLTSHDDGIVRLGMNKGGFGAVVNRQHRFAEVTHWMPLPEPPDCP